MLDFSGGELPSMLLAALATGAFMAGLVDAVVGGGGLIQIPLLFSAFPNTGAAVLFGTNKLSSIVGTTSAAIQYARRVPIQWGIAAPAALAALAASWLGARSVALFPPELLRPLVLVLLVGVAVYTFARKDFGATQQECKHPPSRQAATAIAIGTLIGYYDGFFGPGTGSFLIFCFIRLLGMDFLGASVTAKLVNVATNLAAITYFASHASILWLVGALMAVFNLAGALVGSRLALRHGSEFIRRLFLIVVSALILKLAYDVLRNW